MGLPEDLEVLQSFAMECHGGFGAFRGIPESFSEVRYLQGFFLV